MLRKNVSYSSIYRFQRTILIVLYLVSAISIYVALGFLIYELFNANLFVFILSFIIYLIIAVIFGSFLHIISYIPSNLASAFDPVKNDIATGKINNVNLFAERLMSFITDFFNFAFFDIDHCIIKIKSKEPVSSFDKTIVRLSVNWEDIANISKENKDTVYIKKIKLDSEILHFYLLPIWFGEEWLGYIGILSRNKIWRIFRELLTDFENNFVDDQLIHILKSEV